MILLLLLFVFVAFIRRIFKANATDRVSVLVGTNQLSNDGDRYELETVISHVNFEMTYFHNDITLLRTKKPIEFKATESNYVVNSICLGPYHGRSSYPPLKAVVSGWGSTESGSEEVSDQLLKVSVSLIDQIKCYNAYLMNFELNMSNKVLCYGRKMKDSCQVSCCIIWII